MDDSPLVIYSESRAPDPLGHFYRATHEGQVFKRYPPNVKDGPTRWVRILDVPIISIPHVYALLKEAGHYG